MRTAQALHLAASSLFRAAIALVVMMALTSPASSQEEQSDGAPLEILHGFTLIDGLGGQPVKDAALAIRGHTILEVGTHHELQAQWANDPNVISVDLGGGFVLPGLIDAHIHLATAPNRENAEAELRRLLYSGVTAVRDMAGDGRALASLARDARLGEIQSPDIYYSALMAGPSFFDDPRPQASAAGEVAGKVPWMQAVTPDTDIVETVAAAKGTYAQGIKIYANLEPEEVNRITYEAHRQGMRVWAHTMVFPTRPLNVVRSGVDVVSHVCRLAWEGMAEAPSEYHHNQRPDFDKLSAEANVFTELFEEMKQRGTILDATLALYTEFDERMLLPGSPNPTPPQCDVDFARDLVRRAHAMGVDIVAGTDFSTPANDPFPALHKELEELVAHAGFTALEALTAATATAARALGVDEAIGTLEPGKDVNFVLLNADPIENISNLRTVREVWKNAARFTRTDFVPAQVTTAESSSGSELDTSTPAAMLQSWVSMWQSYNLDWVDDLFVQDDRLTYFSSEFEGVIEGFDAVIEHHRGFGFVPGGTEPSAELWVEKPVMKDLGETAVVGGVWYFGNREAPEDAGRGPMTIVLIPTPEGYRIVHMHFANYEPGA
jgi:imidazolonepropionase-like amidohydrolase